MRLKRLELAILALTLAFAVFMGGYFTGRAHSGGGISPVSPAPSGSNSQPPASGQGQGAGTPEPSQTPMGQNPSGAGQSSPAGQAPAAQAPAPQPPAAVSDGKININTASHGELTDLPGIGPALASRIVDYRTQNGAFQNIEDIRKVSGIGVKRFDAIADLIKVE